MVSYELWETDGGNLLECFNTRGEALSAVKRTARRYGRESVNTFVLAQVDAAGELVPVARGAELLALAGIDGPENDAGETSLRSKFGVG